MPEVPAAGLDPDRTCAASDEHEVRVVGGRLHDRDLGRFAVRDVLTAWRLVADDGRQAGGRRLPRRSHPSPRVGLESRTVDNDSPVSAYVALDHRLPSHPDRDRALPWDEAHGWAIAIETHSGEDLVIIRVHAGPERRCASPSAPAVPPGSGAHHGRTRRARSFGKMTGTRETLSELEP
ncbi:hypothetical protein GCM10027598_36260 [Amycolatopsis oliviviridis]|uniref:DUF6292 domain-containing protein n=1 Tax=Amycolatopsis oliviviridis TaxID=1471590 RepID=A0ABQ3LDP9_9PSEU|nr:hypothetical protein GCM10017790_25570 [Amycolatopsis oliviviridis]